MPLGASAGRWLYNPSASSLSRANQLAETDRCSARAKVGKNESQLRASSEMQGNLGPKKACIGGSARTEWPCCSLDLARKYGRIAWRVELGMGVANANRRVSDLPRLPLSTSLTASIFDTPGSFDSKWAINEANNYRIDTTAQRLSQQVPIQAKCAGERQGLKKFPQHPANRDGTVRTTGAALRVGRPATRR